MWVGGHWTNGKASSQSNGCSALGNHRTNIAYRRALVLVGSPVATFLDVLRPFPS